MQARRPELELEIESIIGKLSALWLLRITCHSFMGHIRGAAGRIGLDWSRHNHVASVKSMILVEIVRYDMLHLNQDPVQGKLKAIQSGLAFALGVFIVVLASLMIAPGADGLLGAYLATLMFAIAYNDARHYLIPNELTAAAFGLALLRVGVTMPNASASSCSGWSSAP